MFRPLDDVMGYTTEFRAPSSMRVRRQAACHAVVSRHLPPPTRWLTSTYRYRYVMVSHVFVLPLLTPEPESLEGSQPTVSPALFVNRTSMCTKVTAFLRGFMRSSRKASWKCVVARTLGQSAPRVSRLLKTPVNSPAPSRGDEAEHD
jgi:hypothetical protein